MKDIPLWPFPDLPTDPLPFSVYRSVYRGYSKPRRRTGVFPRILVGVCFGVDETRDA